MARLFALPLLVLASPALAQLAPTPAGTSTASAPAPAVNEKKICRSDAGTGSLIPKRTCMTKAEWDAVDQHNRQNVDQTIDNARRLDGKL